MELKSRPRLQNEPVRVLLIDDNPDDRALLIRVIQREIAGAILHEVYDSATLEQALQQGAFDIVITDFRLNWIDGVSVLKRIKSRFIDKPVIMFTATANQEDAVEAMRAGLDDYLIKSPKHFARVPVAIQTSLQLSKLRATLRETERMAMVGRMMATVAHEINNPLESLNGLMYMIAQDDTLSESTRALIAASEMELSRIAEVVKRTLGLTRETGSPVKFNLRTLIEDLVKVYVRRFEANAIQVTTYYHDNSDFEGFPGEMRQVVSNLIVNAIDVLQQRGKIWIDLFHSRNWANPEERGLALIIADNGPGIPVEYRRRVFEPFFTTKGERGTGLGLWITDALVRKHAGSVRFRSSTSARNHGTCFQVFLPFGGAQKYSAWKPFAQIA
jgi:two-component system, NtrC family, sensor kinase